MDHRFLRIIKANICLLPGIILLAAYVLHVKASDVEGLKNIWYETRYYPIYQDGPEWQKHSMEDTFEINNPPYDLLFSMSSDELAEIFGSRRVCLYCHLHPQEKRNQITVRSDADTAPDLYL